jgi:hypothetical protein
MREQEMVNPMTTSPRQSESCAGSGGILAVWTDIAPELEAEFNEWYWREHLPERLAVPGFRRGRRYRAIAGAPRYFAFYELDAVEILASPAYLDRLDNPTQWTRRIMPGFRNTTRAAFRLADCIGRVTSAAMLTLRTGLGGEVSPPASCCRTSLHTRGPFAPSSGEPPPFQCRRHAKRPCAAALISVPTGRLRREQRVPKILKRSKLNCAGP